MDNAGEVEKIYQCYWNTYVGTGTMIVGEDAEYLVKLFYGNNENVRYEFRLIFGSQLYGDRSVSSTEDGGDDRCMSGELRLSYGLEDDLCMSSKSFNIRLDGEDVLFRLSPSYRKFDPTFTTGVVSGEYAERVRRILGLGN